MSIFSRLQNLLKREKKFTAVAPMVASPIAISPTAKPWSNEGLRSLLSYLKGTRAEVPQSRSLKLPQPYPGVLPKNTPTMAQDSQIAAVYQFGANYGYGWDGVGFMGYALLVELSQIPEYRRPSEIIANEMTRKWGKVISVSKDANTEKLKNVEDELDRLGAQEAFRRAFEIDTFFGQSKIYIDLGTSGDELRRELTLDAKVGKGSLKALRVIEPIWIYPNQYDAINPLSPRFYRPDSWYVLGIEINSSRLLSFNSRPVPDILKPAYMFGGISLTQLLKRSVDNWLRTRQSVSDITHNFSTPVLMTDMGQTMQPGGAESLALRGQVYNTARDNLGLLIIDKLKEDFKNVAAPISGLDKLQAQAQEQMASEAGIPLVKWFGVTPSGLNASSDGEIRVFYDTIESSQERVGTPPMNWLLEIVQMSLFGEVDPDIGWVWNPLWSLDEEKLANVRKVNAETDQTYIDAGVIAPEETRQTIAAEEGSRYASIDVEEVPDLRDEEEEGLEPKASAEHLADSNEERSGGEDGAVLTPSSAVPIAPKSRKRQAADADFKEGDHPRDDDGKFGSGGGKGKSSGGSAHRSALAALREFGGGESASAAGGGEGGATGSPAGESSATAEQTVKNTPAKLSRTSADKIQAAWESDPKLISRIVRRAKFGAAGEKVEAKFSDMFTESETISDLMADQAEITDEDRSKLGPDEIFEVDQKLEEAHEEAVSYANASYKQMVKLVNLTAANLGPEQAADVDGMDLPDDAELSSLTKSQIDKISSLYSRQDANGKVSQWGVDDLANDVNDAAEQLDEALSDEYDEDDESESDTHDELVKEAQGKLFVALHNLHDRGSKVLEFMSAISRGEDSEERGGDDARGPFASDSSFKEGDHPRAPDGKFGSGSGKSAVGSQHREALKSLSQFSEPKQGARSEATKASPSHAVTKPGNVSFVDKLPDNLPDDAEVETDNEDEADGSPIMYDVAYTYENGNVNAAVGNIRVQSEDGEEFSPVTGKVKSYKINKELGSAIQGHIEDLADGKTEEARWDSLAPEQQASEVAAEEAKAEEAEQAHTKKINYTVDRVLAGGWKPTFNEYGGLHSGKIHPDLKGFASPKSLGKVMARLKEKSGG